jgi:hypothetical protein
MSESSGTPGRGEARRAKGNTRRSKPEVLEFDFAAETSQLVQPETPEPAEVPTPEPGPAPTQPEISETPPEKISSSNSSEPMAITPPSINDFKRNAERQTREQRTAGSLLSIIVWVVVGGLFLVAGLAAYGGYVLSSQIKNQAVTVQQLQAKTEQDNADLREDLNRTRSALADVVNAVNKQQDRLNRLSVSLEETQAVVRAEKTNRQNLERRLRAVEVVQAQAAANVQSR